MDIVTNGKTDGEVIKNRTYEVRDRLAGIRCGWKGTSCPYQLARALNDVLAQ